MIKSSGNLLRAETSVLLVVDVQERLAPAIAGRARLLANVERLCRAASRLAVPIEASEHYPGGLGPTVAELEAVVPMESRFEKITFSCLGEPGFAARLEALGRPQVVVAGCEAHVCVLQSAISLAEAGYHTYIVADATGSRDPVNAERALARMVEAGITAVTTEMVLFEWLERGDHPAFKDLLKLIK